MFYHGFSGLFRFTISLICMSIPIAILIGFICAVVWVHKDSTRRGMNSLLWTLIVLMVPSFIGFVIYLSAIIFLSARTSSNPNIIKCKNCGNSIEASSNVCPYCGHTLKKTCPSCERLVDSNWRNCPTCGTILSEKVKSNNQNDF